MPVLSLRVDVNDRHWIKDQVDVHDDSHQSECASGRLKKIFMDIISADGLELSVSVDESDGVNEIRKCRIVQPSSMANGRIRPTESNFDHDDIQRDRPALIASFRVETPLAET